MNWKFLGDLYLLIIIECKGSEGKNLLCLCMMGFYSCNISRIKKIFFTAFKGSKFS